MSGMFRLKDEAALQELIKKGSVRESTSGMYRTHPAPKALAPVRRAPAGPSPAGMSNQAALTSALVLAPVVKAPRKESEIERRFAQQIRAAGLPEPEREYYHITGRDFRLDFAWPAIKLGVEVQGMAHRIKGKFHADMEKRILAQINGWLVMEISGDMVRHDTAIAWLVILMGQRK
jgi:very-short-patch-repair endonuclease